MSASPYPVARLNRSCPAWRILCALVVTLLLSGLALAAGAPTENDANAPPPPLRVSIGIVDNNEPYSWIEDGRVTGFSIDVLEALAAQANIEFEYRAGSWPELYPAFLRGEIDAIDEISYRPDRASQMLFTEPYHYRQTVIMHSLDRPLPPVSSLEQLRPYRVGIVSDIYYKSVLLEHQIPVVEYNGLPNLLRALAFGWVDAIAGPEVTLRFLARKSGFNQLAVAGRPSMNGLEMEDFRIAVGLDRTALHQRLQAALAAIPTTQLRHLEEIWQEFGGREIDATTPADVLSEQSRAYVRRLGPVRVGIMRDYPPFSFHDGGKVQGLAVDMLTRVQDLTGLQVIPVTDRWSVLIDLFQRGEIDVMSNISFSPEREAFARFTHPYHVIPNVAFTRRPELRLNSPEDLRGLRIALGNGIYYEAPLRRLFSDDVVAFSSQQSMFAALAEGTVDVVLAALPHGNHWVRELALADVRVAGELQLDGIGGEDLRFAVRPALEPLAGIIDQALQRISPTELRTIEDRWLGAAVEDAGDRTRGADDAAQPIVLNAAEQDYLQSRGHSLSVCVTPNWMPMVGLNQDGLLTGMSSDFLTLFTKRSGIQFEITPLPSLKASLQAMMDRSCDILPLAMKTSERLAYLNFTTPLYVVPSVVLGRRETPFIDDMSELNDKSVGIVRDSAFIELMRTRYPQIRLVMVDNQEDGLRRLQRGDVYAYLGTLLTASHYLQQHRITDIKFIGRAPLDGALAMATRNDHPELAGIAQKLVDSITDQERQTIETNWRTLHVEERIDYRLLWQIVLAALLILSALFFWNRKLKTLNRRLAEANRLLEAHNLIDGLTEIGNRKYFDREFPRNFQQCRRNRLGFMVAMVDIDHFKQVNDTWGHAVGDQCLQQLATCLREHFRRGTDHLARIGGEEFVVFASFEDEDEAKACFEALRQKVAALRIRAGNDTFGFTISIGLYLKKPVSAREASECLKIADEALYEAKRSGRNRCVVHNRLEDPQQRARSEVPG